MFISDRYQYLLDYVIPGKGVLRSLAKTVTWRIIATADTFLLGYLVVPFVLNYFFGMDIEHDVAFAGSIATFEVVTKMVIYFLHERAWARVGHHRYPPKRRQIRINCRECGTENRKLVETEVKPEGGESH